MYETAPRACFTRSMASLSGDTSSHERLVGNVGFRPMVAHGFEATGISLFVRTMGLASSTFGGEFPDRWLEDSAVPLVG